MSKRKEEERRILAELDEAVKAENEKGGEAQPKEAEKMRCPRCKSVMEKGVCPACGHKIYIPMDEGKRRRMKRIITVVCLVAFAIIFVVMKLSK